MKKFVTKDDFPQIEMELFSKEYPCYLTMNIYVLDIINSNVNISAYSYETELINGKWLLKTKDN